MASNAGDEDKSNWGKLLGWLDKEGMPSPADMLGKQNWVESYVRKAISQALPPVAAIGDKPGTVNAELFDTHHFVIVKWKLPKRVKEEELRLFVRTDRVKLEGVGDGASVVKLPVAVDPWDCRALCREGVLQLKARKRPVDRVYQEIDIRFS